MGAWGADPFENDDAADWRYLLLDGGGTEVVAAALADPSEEGETAACAVAAAALVAAGVDLQVTLPDDMVGWLAAQDHVALRALAPLAVTALDRVLAGSELRELWDESGVDDWHAVVQGLRDGLAGVIAG